MSDVLSLTVHLLCVQREGARVDSVDGVPRGARMGRAGRLRRRAGAASRAGRRAAAPSPSSRRAAVAARHAAAPRRVALRGILYMSHPTREGALRCRVSVQ